MSHLEPEQIEHFRELLESAKASAEALLKQTAGGRVETSGGAIGRLTRMDAIQSQAMSEMSRQQLQVRVQQIDAALRAIEKGTYGTCRNCGGPIVLARLEALPEVPFCVDCQESME